MKKLLALFILLGGVSYPGSFVSGSAACSSSGAVQVSTTYIALRQITVSALLANTGKIYIGGSNVSATSSPPIGGELGAGYSYNATDGANTLSPTTLYIACTVSSDNVSWIGRQ